MSGTIVWFRQDLRLNDNAALSWACSQKNPIIPIFIANGGGEGEPGAASKWWLYNSLKSLSRDLSTYNLTLKYFSGDIEHIFQNLIYQTNANSLVYNEVYEPSLIKQDKKLFNKLRNKIHIKPCANNLFSKPGSLLNNQGKPYRVFTPFWKKLRKNLELENVITSDNQLEKNHGNKKIF